MDYCLTKETGILKNTAEVPHRLSSITRAGFFSLTVGFLCLFCCFRLPFLCWNLHEGHNIKILKKKKPKRNKLSQAFWKTNCCTLLRHVCPFLTIGQNHTPVCVLVLFFGPVTCLWLLRARESAPSESHMKADSASPLCSSFGVRLLGRGTLAWHLTVQCSCSHVFTATI